MKTQLQTALGHLAPKADARLDRMCTLRIGGPADILIRVEDSESLLETLQCAASHSTSVTTIGLGSNVVVPDEGVRGIVVRLGGTLTGVRPADERPLHEHGDVAERLVEVGAGAVNAHVVRDLHRAGLVGVEFLALVPGTIGGAVVMNAGTRWGELSEALDSVELVSAKRGRRWVDAAALNLSYRHSELPAGNIVTRARIRVRPGDAEEAARAVADEKAYREKTQPYKLATNGSVFANPPDDAAGRLIDAAGLKGTRDGGAVISEKHANWIVNTGDATATNVLRLMRLARDTVENRFGVRLRPEVRVLGAGDATADLLDRIENPLPVE